jgi:photosystem II stability/assembly factor-like uncharacterized protein
MRLRLTVLTHVLLSFLVGESVLGQWKNLAPGLIQTISINQKIIYVEGNIWVSDQYGYLWNSSDDGNTWQKITTPISIAPIQNPRIEFFSLDFYDANNGIISGRNYDLTANSFFLFTTSDGGKSWISSSQDLIEEAHYLSSTQIVGCIGRPEDILMSNDGGLTWKNISPQGQFQNGLHINNLEVGKSDHSINFLIQYDGYIFPSIIYFTKDYGLTWESTSTFQTDCWSLALSPCNANIFYVINEGTLTPESDSLGRVLCSDDLGKTFSQRGRKSFNYYSGSLICTGGGILYCQSRTSDGIVRSTDRGLTWSSIGGPAGIEVDTRLICYKNDNTVFALSSDGSIWGTVNSGGDSIIPEINPVVLSLETRDQSTDTIGISTLHVPIKVKGLIKSRDVELILHYDNDLDYQGSYSSNLLKLDMPGEQWQGRSKLYLSAVSDDSDEYSDFVFYSDKQQKQKVWFDSINIVNVTLPCGELSTTGNIATSIIFPPSGCGINNISTFMLTGKLPEFSVHPNPAANSLTIESNISATLPQMNIFDQLGRSVLHTKDINFIKDNKVILDVSGLSSGMYFLRVETNGFSRNQAVVIKH